MGVDIVAGFVSRRLKSFLRNDKCSLIFVVATLLIISSFWSLKLYEAV